MLKRACCPASSTTRCGAVLAAVALASTSLFALAARPASGDERGSSDALREGSLDLDRSARESRGEDGGVAGACTVTWPVFATTAMELSISVMGGPCSGDAQAGNITIDLDGDGTEELLRSDDWTPGKGDGDAAVRCLRRVGGAWNDEVLLLWDPAVTTYPWLVGEEGLDYLIVDPAGLLDCDGDGQRDLLVRTIHYPPGSPGVTSYGYFRNQLPPPQSASAADINRDGVVNGADLTMLLVAWAQGG